MSLPLKWQSQEETTSLAEYVPVVVEESRRHPMLLVTIFAVIALGALAIGLTLPKKYTSRTTIFVEDSNIIGPLMEGRAVPTAVANRAAITREVAFSSRVMQEILKTGGWLDQPMTPVEHARLVESVIERTRITNPGERLIQISYSDADARRAYRVAKRFAEMVISESLATKERESKDAFAFIDSQVRQYHHKLVDAEAKLERYRRSNPDARPGVETDVNARIGELRRTAETAQMELADLNSQETALKSQLSDENQVIRVQNRTSQQLTRLAELETERDRLLMSFTERHPDVVRVQHQISDLKDDLRREETLAKTRPASTTDGESGATLNPLHGELRRNLSDVRSRSAATGARINASNNLLNQELARSRHIASSDSTVAELTRDYEVNRDLYQDLMRRRENARVSMNLDAESRGLSFRVEEPASIPVRGSGVRVTHIAGGGFSLALIAPLALLFGLVRLDPRLRSARAFDNKSGLPLLTVIPAYYTRSDRKRQMGQLLVTGSIVAVVLIAYAAMYAYKIANG